MIEDDTEVVQDKDWTSLPTTHIDPEVVTDASIFSPQTQPTSEPKDETKTVTIAEPTPRGRPPVKLPDFEQADPIPNTGGRYPATVVHRADVIVETDLDTGEHTAALVELKGEPQVGERQPLQAAAKNIQGRTLAVDVLTGGGFEVNPIKRKGRHTVRPQEVEGILPLPKAKKQPKLKPPRPAIPRPQRVGTKGGSGAQSLRGSRCRGSPDKGGSGESHRRAPHPARGRPRATTAWSSPRYGISRPISNGQIGPQSEIIVYI